MVKNVKCRWCGETREVMNNQRSFSCLKCSKSQKVGRLTLIDNSKEEQTQTRPFDDKGDGVVEEAQPKEEVKSQSSSDDITTETEEVEETEVKEVKEAVGENLSDTPAEASKDIAELEIVEEKPQEEPQRANPDDYDYRCSKCAELFNEEGNINNNIIKCPDCGLEVLKNA